MLKYRLVLLDVNACHVRWLRKLLWSWISVIHHLFSGFAVVQPHLRPWISKTQPPVIASPPPAVTCTALSLSIATLKIRSRRYKERNGCTYQPDGSLASHT
ncbi:hypothetical protein DFH11DRAFT_776578 [Phellopilus nigrolimitatus]|nr:hypothetical protein DFH11DRAFT_776578 [Phellopilus nigrolimitatus]